MDKGEAVVHYLRAIFDSRTFILMNKLCENFKAKVNTKTSLFQGIFPAKNKENYLQFGQSRSRSDCTFCAV